MERDKQQRGAVVYALSQAFCLDFSRNINLEDIQRMVRMYNSLLFKPEGYSLKEESINRIALFANGAFQEKYLCDWEVQFELIKSLRNALIEGAGSKFCFDFSGAAKRVGDKMLEAFNLQDLAKQNPQTMPIFYVGMENALRTLAE